MKKVKGLFLASALVLSAGVVASFSTRAISKQALADGLNGDGSKENPYQIASKADLLEFHDIVEGVNGKTRNTSACAVLTDDIDLDFMDWEPIGKADLEDPANYQGTFDGHGHSITNLYINKAEAGDDNGFGLFATTGYESVIKNLKLYGNVSVLNGSHIGGFAGMSTGTFFNCYNYVTINGYSAIGGLVGSTFQMPSPTEDGAAHFEKCCNFGSVTGLGFGCGGILGSDSIGKPAHIKDCFNAGDVTSNGFVQVGGVAGCATKMETSHNVGTITGDHAVALCGSIPTINDIRYCYYLEGSSTIAKGTNLDDAYNHSQSLSSDDMKDVSKYNGFYWNFVDVWVMGTDYPVFSYEYALFVGNVHADTDHTSGEGWEYDYYDNTLILNNFSYSGLGYDDPRNSYHSPIAYSGSRPFNLILNGTNTLTVDTNEEFSVSGFNAGSKVTVSGEGSLNITVSGHIDNYSDSFGMNINQELVVNSGSITANVTRSGGYEASGIRVFSGSITLNGGSIVAHGFNAGVAAVSSDAIVTLGRNLSLFEATSDDANTYHTALFAFNANKVIVEMEGLQGWASPDGSGASITVPSGEYKCDYEHLEEFPFASLRKVYYASVQPYQEVVALIDAIGEVTYTDECKAKIDAATTAYNALSEEQKAKVTNKSTLDAAIERYNYLKEQAENNASGAALPGWALALIIVGSVLVLACLCVLALFFLCPRYVVVDNKVVRTILVFKKDDKVTLVSTKCKFIKADKANVYKTKEEAEKALNK